MRDFPDFMKNEANRVGTGQQNTKGVEGYYYTARDGSQMAFWTCEKEQESQEHCHAFDEYMVCVSGCYHAVLNGKEIILMPGDELFIPKGTVQSGYCFSGTRTIHAIGGQRIR